MYALHPDLLYEVTRVVSELQIFLERTSAMIPERTSHFKVDPRDTLVAILKESSDHGQIHAAWMGLSRRMALAQENLYKYEMQYRGPLEGEDSLVPTSPISTDVRIYEAIEGEEDRDFCMRHIYENIPHHQDQIHSPRKLRNGTAWSSIIPLPNNIQDSTTSTLPTIPEQEYTTDSPEEVTSRRDKGKRRITDEFTSPPTSPRVLNVGYGTPFKSSSQFFVRPGIPLPPSEALSQKSVLLGLGLPKTPAFENISNAQVRDTRNIQKTLQPRASNPFEGRDMPRHMNTGHQARTPIDMSTPGPSNNNQYYQTQEIHPERDPSAERQSTSRRGGQRGQPDGDPGDDDDDDSSDLPRHYSRPPNRDTPN